MWDGRCGGGAGRRPGSIVWGPRRPTGRRVDCVGNPTPKAPGQLIPLKNVQTVLEKLHEKSNLTFYCWCFYSRTHAPKNTLVNTNTNTNKHLRGLRGAPLIDRRSLERHFYKEKPENNTWNNYWNEAWNETKHKTITKCFRNKLNGKHFVIVSCLVSFQVSFQASFQ